jgi:hypothetical protein
VRTPFACHLRSWSVDSYDSVILLHGLTLFNSPRTSGNWKTLLQARLPENSSLAEYLLDTTVRTQQEWKNLLSMGDYLLEAVHEFYLKLGVSFLLAS